MKINDFSQNLLQSDLNVTLELNLWCVYRGQQKQQVRKCLPKKRDRKNKSRCSVKQPLEYKTKHLKNTCSEFIFSNTAGLLNFGIGTLQIATILPIALWPVVCRITYSLKNYFTEHPSKATSCFSRKFAFLNFFSYQAFKLKC